MDPQLNSEIVVFSPSRAGRKLNQFAFLIASAIFGAFSLAAFKYGEEGANGKWILGCGAAAGSVVMAIAALTDIFLGHKIRVCLGKEFLIVGNYGEDKQIELSEIKEITSSYDRIWITTSKGRVTIDDAHFSFSKDKDRFLTLLSARCGQ